MGTTVARSWRDVVYADYGVIVELDGATTHPPELRRSDQWRDNEALASHDGVTPRYGWWHVHHDPCATADQVARVLRGRGWPGFPRPCGAGCPLPLTA